MFAVIPEFWLCVNVGLDCGYLADERYLCHMFRLTLFLQRKLKKNQWFC